MHSMHKTSHATVHTALAEILLSVTPMLLSLPSKPVTRTHVWDSTYVISKILLAISIINY